LIATQINAISKVAQTAVARVIGFIAGVPIDSNMPLMLILSPRH
jgi:hypothetical protein